MNEYYKELLEDFKKFHQTVGGAIELADRDWDSEVWCNDKYKETIVELYQKYPIANNESFIPIKIDDYLEIEDKVADYLEEKILEVLNG